MSWSRIFWMAVQAFFICLLTLPALLDPKMSQQSGNVVVIFAISVLLVAFFTSLITNGKDSIVRRWRGIPAPPRVDIPGTLGTALERRSTDPSFSKGPADPFTVYWLLTIAALVVSVGAKAIFPSLQLEYTFLVLLTLAVISRITIVRLSRDAPAPPHESTKLASSEPRRIDAE